ncbi:MAG: LamG-like jellyroll fold domain-containing protein, partial [Bacteroidia bacterium]
MLKIRPIPLLLFLLFLAGFSPGAWAQGLEMTVSNANGAADTDVTVDISVRNFNTLYGYQGTIAFDETVLEYVGASSPNPGVVNLVASSAPTNTIPNNKLTFLWNDINLVGVSLPNDAIILSLTFHIKAGQANGTVSPISIDGTETDLGYVDSNFNFNNSIGVTNGTVTTLITQLSLQDSLIAWYPFDGDPLDYSGNDNHGTLGGAVLTTDRFGNANSAFSFNGSSDFISIANNQKLQPQLPVTLSAWVYIDDYNLNNVFRNNFQTTLYNGIIINIVNGYVQPSIGDGGPTGPAARRSKTGTTLLTLNTWYHIACVIRDPQDMDIFINGKNDCGIYSGSGSTLNYISSDDGRIGEGSSINNTFYNGKIDEIRFYNRALDKSEIRILADFPPQDSILFLGDALQLDAGYGSLISWSPTAGLSCTTCSDPIATPNVSTIYTAITANTPGCLDTVILSLTVNPSNTGPCECAQRWEDGAVWAPNDCSGGIDESQNPPAGSSSKGIIECGSAANTQSNISANCTYDPAGFQVDLSGQVCIDPSSGIPFVPQPMGPTSGEPVIWLQFDVRPNAGNFQIQINDNDAADNPAWALYYSTESQSCTDAPGTDGNTFELAGDCSSLVFATCGVESSSTWNTIPVPNFSETTNYYIVLWDQNADGNFDLNNFKARFGCGVTGGGGSDPICVVEETNTTTECGTNGELVVTTQVSGINGTYVATDNTGATGVSYIYTSAGGATNTTGLVLTNSTGTGEITGTVTVMYPAGTTNYGFDVTNTDPTSSPPPEDPNACTITVSGTAAACPVCDVSLVSAVQSPDACVAPANGSIVAIATSSTGTLEFSLDGIDWFTGTATANPDEYTYTFTGLGPASYQVRVRDIGVSPVCCDIGTPVVINALPSPAPVISGDNDYCEGGGVVLDAGLGYASYTWSTTATSQMITVQAGSYTVTVTNADGCSGDSAPFTVTENPTITNTDAITICATDLPYTYGTQSLAAAGVYTESFTALSTGCDSIVSLTLTVDPTATAGANNSATVCEGDIIELTTLVTVPNGTFLDPTASGGLSGTQFNTTGLNGIYPIVYNVSSGNSCPDAAAVITIIVQPTKTGTDAVTICDGDTYVFGTQSLTAAGTYDETFTANNGCDSVVTLTLTVNPTKMGTDAATICSNETYTFGTQTLSTGGTFMETFTADNGCDSVVTLTLTVNPTKMGTDAAT